MLYVHAHARKHGVPDAATIGAWVNAFEAVFYEHEDGSVRWIVLGPDGGTGVLEGVWIDLGDGDFLAIHSQRARKSTIKLLRSITKGGQ